MKKVICFLVLSILIVSMFSTYASAYNDKSISLCGNNSLNVIANFQINSSGKATITVGYIGYNGITSGGKITTKIEKLVSGNWQTVNIGVQNNQWVDESTLVNFSTSHSVQLKSKGTYRAVVVFEISGSGGATDVIERTIEKTY